MSNQSAYASAELATELRGESPGESVRTWAGLIDDRETLELLNHLDTVLSEPVEEAEIGKEIISNQATKTIDESVRAGNISQMKGVTGLTNQTKESESFYSEAAKRLTYEGSIGLVFGAPGSGKTATILDVGKVWKAITGGSIIGNIETELTDRTFTSDTELLEQMGSMKGPVLALLDEIGQELSGFGSGSKEAEAMSDSLLFIRKQEDKHGKYAKKGSVLAVSHTRTKTAKSIRRIASWGIEKPQKARKDRARIIESEGGKDEWSNVADYQGLSDTSVNYNEYQASEFQILESYDGDENTTQEIDHERRSQIRTALTLCLEQDSTYQEAAEAVDFSKGWVSDRVQEFRSGELDWLNIEPEKNE